MATSNGILTLTNCTVSGNSGTDVEGLAAYGSSTTTLNNTIVAGNSGGFQDVIGKMSGSNNLIGTGYPAGIDKRGRRQHRRRDQPGARSPG